MFGQRSHVTANQIAIGWMTSWNILVIRYLQHKVAHYGMMMSQAHRTPTVLVPKDDASKCGQQSPVSMLIATSPYRPTLAGCFRTSDGVQLPARSSASVPRGIVPSANHCRCRVAAISPIRQPPARSQSYRATGSAPTADGLSLWVVRRYGDPCRRACGIRSLTGTISDDR